MYFKNTRMHFRRSESNTILVSSPSLNSPNNLSLHSFHEHVLVGDNGLAFSVGREMSSAKDPTKKEKDPPAPTPPAGNVESQTAEAGFGAAGTEKGFVEARVVGVARVGNLGLLLSLLTFDKYEEYRYVLAIAIGSTVYTGVQALRQVHELSTGKQQIFSQRSLAFVDFFGDQIVAYLLVSAAASTVPITNRMREGADNIFTDSSAAAISIELLAFLALAFSALVSGYKLSNQSYV